MIDITASEGLVFNSIQNCTLQEYMVISTGFHKVVYKNGKSLDIRSLPCIYQLHAFTKSLQLVQEVQDMQSSEL